MLVVADTEPAAAKSVAPIVMSDVELRRLEAVFEADFGFVSRVLRSYRVPERDLDDAVQQVFIVFARKVAQVTLGRERGFLYLTALHVAAHVRRSRARRREALGYVVPEKVEEHALSEEVIDGRRASARLMDKLERLDAGAREVFVLHDVGHWTMDRIATALALPPGTVASRLRRARAALRTEVKRLQQLGDAVKNHP
jgi:RNA polymerase sigma-70 factor (ECF subfamily)